MSSKKKSCLGCGAPRAEDTKKVLWDLPFRYHVSPGYVLFRKKTDKLPMRKEGIEKERIGQVTGNETAGFVSYDQRVARIRYGLRATYPTLSDDDL